MPAPNPLTLYGEPGWGSAIIEAQLVWLGLAFTFQRVGDLFAAPEARALAARVNPLGQIPSLVLADGTVLTESAAITLYLADLTGRDELVPGPASPARPAFLRWLVFIAANIYPTYTYTDDPARFVAAPEAQAGFKDAVDAYAQRLYRLLDGVAGAPWFLGEQFSALDLYIVVLTHWRPGRDWFAPHTPALASIARRAEALAPLREAWARSFPG
jgi:GST-like protein